MKRNTKANPSGAFCFPFLALTKRLEFFFFHLLSSFGNMATSDYFLLSPDICLYSKCLSLSMPLGKNTRKALWVWELEVMTVITTKKCCSISSCMKVHSL